MKMVLLQARSMRRSHKSDKTTIPTPVLKWPRKHTLDEFKGLMLLRWAKSGECPWKNPAWRGIERQTWCWGRFIFSATNGWITTCIASVHHLHPLGKNLRRRGGFPSPISTWLLSVLPCHDHVPMILHCIISPSRKEPSNHRPFVSIESVSSQKPFLFFLSKSSPIDPWI